VIILAICFVPQRTDIHRLFDLGYVTISRDRRFEVNPRLREDYENGKVYYDLHGQRCGSQRIPLSFRQQTRSIGTIRIGGRVRGTIGRLRITMTLHSTDVSP
jgi:hypothetical protein